MMAGRFGGIASECRLARFLSAPVTWSYIATGENKVVDHLSSSAAYHNPDFDPIISTPCEDLCFEFLDAVKAELWSRHLSKYVKGRVGRERRDLQRS